MSIDHPPGTQVTVNGRDLWVEREGKDPRWSCFREAQQRRISPSTPTSRYSRIDSRSSTSTSTGGPSWRTGFVLGDHLRP
jgi:hypothetical protein